MILLAALAAPFLPGLPGLNVANGPNAVLVTYVATSSPAFRAGIRSGDLIVGGWYGPGNTRVIRNVADLQNFLRGVRAPYSLIGRRAGRTVVWRLP